MSLCAVFLDRDGTINPDPGYIDSPDKFRLFPDTIPALGLLAQAGYQLFLVTNQSGIGRGYFGHEDLALIHEKMHALLKKGGVELSDLRYCPHLPDSKCSCRKPSSKMVRDLARKHKIDLACSWFIGDKLSDIKCGKDAGCRTVAVGNDRQATDIADFKAPNILEAVRIILREMQ